LAHTVSASCHTIQVCRLTNYIFPHFTPNSAIDFTFRALKRTVGNPKEELAESFRISYKETLKPYHPFWIKPVFTASMSLCPYRAAFIANLGDDAKQATSELKTHLEALSKTINILSPFIEAKAANKWK
jgi:hypothetical protein